MKKMYFTMCMAAFCYVILLTSCEKKEELDLSKDIKNIVPDTTLNKIINLGMFVNKGTKPPKITNIYKAAPFILKATNVPNDWNLGTAFADYKFKLYDQDNDKLSIKLDYIGGPETGTGIGGFISGDGDNFSVFVKVHAVNSGSPCEMLHIISGTITAEGIKDFYFANFMIEDYGDPKNVWMAEENGRVFYDSDGVSPIIQSLQGKAADIFKGISSGAGLK